MISAVQQKGLENLGIARHKTGAQARQVGTLGQAVEHHATLEIAAAQLGAGGQQARRWRLLVKVQLAVALVGSDHEVILVGQSDQLFQRDERDQRPRRIAGRAQKQNLAALPDLGRDRVEVRVEAIVIKARQVVRRGPGQQRGTLVDLIKRIGADHQAVGAALYHGLGKGEQCFTRTVDRQHVARRIDPARGHPEAALAPVANSFAQGRHA